MNRLSSSLNILRRASPAIPQPPAVAAQKQWTRGIRVRVIGDNLEQALKVMENKMRSSGMERLFKRKVDYHVKNSEKRILARKNLELRLRSMDFARKLQIILTKKIRLAVAECWDVSTGHIQQFLGDYVRKIVQRL